MHSYSQFSFSIVPLPLGRTFNIYTLSHLTTHLKSHGRSETRISPTYHPPHNLISRPISDDSVTSHRAPRDEMIFTDPFSFYLYFSEHVRFSGTGWDRIGTWRTGALNFGKAFLGHNIQRVGNGWYGNRNWGKYPYLDHWAVLMIDFD